MATDTAASRKRGAAARSEVNGRPKSITVRGTRLKLEPTVKFRVLNDMRKIRREDGSADIDAIVESLGRILGTEEMDKVWEIDIKPGKDGLQVALMQLLDEVTEKVFTAYGVTPGE